MMRSNEPYQRVSNHDPVYNGAAYGALAGAASMGVVHAGAKGASLISAARSAKKDSTPLLPEYGSTKKTAKAVGVGGKVERGYGKVFGGGWKKAGFYAGAAVLGGGIGAGIDYMSD
ncbi:hypothetical protein PUW25_25410 (plasmid) [Paenibacillus urinalis]|uniref:Uncharacterized protein n=1 Tax=Paenibacillus urinalis TaxID=521520 RepID=A0ABY7XHB8_9BACL|nr:hypothetical protein [Paenibacillus urinalis]WDI05149.1 hypothetical protein PUW25_25410 [Paenibacillus urinalis]